jgi:hypothetical protein
MNAEAFRTELEALVNKHSMERGSQTPDFILAKYMLKCLTNFDEASVERDTWYGRQSNGEPFPKGPVPPTPIDVGTAIHDPVSGALVGTLRSVGGGGGGAAGSVQGPIPGGAGGNAGGVQGPSDPLTTSEESDWRTFAFAQTQKIVWNRASVQRLFATIDAQRAARLECERQLQASFNRCSAALEDVNVLRSDRDAATKKWQEYERDYILPCFQWAKELGIDLEQRVLANPGHNCVETLVSILRRDRSARVSGS